MNQRNVIWQKILFPQKQVIFLGSNPEQLDLGAPTMKSCQLPQKWEEGLDIHLVCSLLCRDDV